MNTIRAHLSEFGIVVAKGIHNVDRLLETATELPDAARPAIDLLSDQLRETQEKIDAVTARIEAAQKTDPLARRLAGLRPFTPRTVHRTVRRVPRTGAHSRASAPSPRARSPRHAEGVPSGTTPEVDNFRSARDLFVGKTVHWTVFSSSSPWLGLTPQPHSSGG